MSKYVIEDTTLSSIADAIRAKTGKEDAMTPEQMPTEIASITGGGSGGGSAEGCVIVTFMNGDVELFKRPVYIGDDCPDPIDQGHIATTPTKESTVQYDYTYYGWGASDNGAADSTILQNITEDKTVYAIYTSTVRTYTITYLDDDGVTVLHTEQVPYGTVPSYTPTKAGHVLTGWTPTPSAVTGDATYIAIWQEVIGGSCGDNATWELSSTGLLTISGTGAMDDYSTGSQQPWAAYRNDITTIEVQSGITSIGERAFAGCANCTKVIMRGGTVTTIGAYAFANCSELNTASTIVYYGSVTDWKGTSGSKTVTLSKSNMVSLGSYYWGLYRIADAYPSYEFTKQ